MNPAFSNVGLNGGDVKARGPRKVIHRLAMTWAFLLLLPLLLVLLALIAELEELVALQWVTRLFTLWEDRMGSHATLWILLEKGVHADDSKAVTSRSSSDDGGAIGPKGGWWSYEFILVQVSIIGS